MQLSYRYRIYPSNIQKDFLAKQFGCCRFVYNYFLNICSSDRSIKPTYKLIPLLTPLKKEPQYSFLKECSAVALQQSLMDLVTAYQNFFAGNRKYPRFKTKYSKQSFRLAGDDAFKLRGNSVYLAKCPGDVKIKYHRPMPSSPTSATISMNKAGQYFISFICLAPDIDKPVTSTIGIDLGIKDFCITSSGVNYDNPRYFVNSEKRLAKLNRSLSRKQSGSNNRNKARLKIAKLNRYIVNQRNDFLHKLSTKLISENQVICLEDLTSSNMMRNRKLSKHIADVSWGRFSTLLAYKAERYQRQLMVMNTFTPSTQTCSACHVQRVVRLTLKERSWVCDHCGADHDRDVNAARVIHSVGMQYWYKEQNNLATLMIVPRWKNGEFLI